MAFDLEQENARHAATWKGFMTFTVISCVAIAVVLILMALTLL
jgi:hypothetical protein